jgi:hypothetical protein
MRPREHILKARRLDASLNKLSPENDFEMVIDLCMLAATHLLNAALHVEGVTHGHSDQSHTKIPPMEYYCKTPGEVIQSGTDALAVIEKLRPTYVRGPKPFDALVAESCLANYATAKNCFLKVIGDAANSREWSELSGSIVESTE